MKRRIFFQHIPKTAGTSLEKAFAEIYGESKVTPKLSLRVPEALSRYPSSMAVCGHFQVSRGDRLPSGYYALTVLRDPIDRFLSEFYFAKHDFQTLTQAGQWYRDLSIEEFIANPDARAAYVWNGQTSILYPYSFDGPTIPEPEERLAAARKTLESLDLVAIHDEIEDALPMMAYELGWPSIPHLSRENVTTRRIDVDALKASERAKIAKLNALDIELFEHARKLFRAKRRSILSVAVGASPRQGGKTDGPVLPAAAADAQDAPISPSEFGDRSIEITSVTVQADSGPPSHVYTGEMLRIRVEFLSHVEEPDLTVGVSIRDTTNRVVFGTNTNLLGLRIGVAPGDSGAAEFELRNDLGNGRYEVTAALHPGESYVERAFHLKDSAAQFDVLGNLGEHFDGMVKLYPRVTLTRDGKKQAAAAGNYTILLGRSNRTLGNFSARLTCHCPPATVTPGAQFTMPIDVMNTGTDTWPAHGDKPVRVSYHWLDADYGWIAYEGIRSPLPADCRPGETVRVPLLVRAPDYEGPCFLVVTPIQEQVAWFENLEPSAKVTFEISVRRKVANAPS